MNVQEAIIPYSITILRTRFKIRGNTKKGYRGRALQELNYRCIECEFSPNDYYLDNPDEYILTVHHIDLNRRNNKISNLEFRCEHCHVIIHTHSPHQLRKRKKSIENRNKFLEIYKK